jgi:uncharacterized protein (TIGR00255 family)
MKSMTGFGRVTVEKNGHHCTVELRTVNHRYFDLSLRLPHSLQGLEPEVRRFLQERIPRGSVSGSVIVDGNEADGAGTVVLNAALAARYVTLLRELQARYGLAGEIDINTVANLPDVFATEPMIADDQAMWPVVQLALQNAVERVEENRTREGDHLVREFESRLTKIVEVLDALERRGPDRARLLKERFRTRVTALAPEAELDAGRIAQEIVLLADRIDYTEECVRLRVHCQQFRDMMAMEGPHGRRLNFLVQEMGREANTIGSKANDPEISALVIDIKEEIEKLREQVQNIE